MVYKARVPAVVGVRLKVAEKKAIERHSEMTEMTESALGRLYILEGLERDGVEIEG
jgi:hypothetical protein